MKSLKYYFFFILFVPFWLVTVALPAIFMIVGCWLFLEGRIDDGIINIIVFFIGIIGFFTTYWGIYRSAIFSAYDNKMYFDSIKIVWKELFGYLSLLFPGRS